MKLKRIDLDNFDSQLESYSIKAVRNHLNCLAANINKVIDEVNKLSENPGEDPDDISEHRMTVKEAYEIVCDFITDNQVDWQICESKEFWEALRDGFETENTKAITCRDCKFFRDYQTFRREGTVYHFCSLHRE